MTRKIERIKCIPLVSACIFIFLDTTHRLPVHNVLASSGYLFCLIMFNNEKYLLFPGVGDISPFSEAFILSVCTNSTQGLVVFSYEILMRVTVPSNHHPFQGAKVLLTVLTPCHPSSFPETSAHIDFFFSQIKGCFLGKPNLDSHPGSARFQ